MPSTTINLTDSLKLKYTLLRAGTCGRSEWYPPLWDNFKYFYVTTFNVLGRLDVSRPWGAARRSSVGCHTAPSIQTTWLVDVCKFYAACNSTSSRRPAKWWELWVSPPCPIAQWDNIKTGCIAHQLCDLGRYANLLCRCWYELVVCRRSSPLVWRRGSRSTGVSCGRRAPEGAMLGSVHSVERTSVWSREIAWREGPSASWCIWLHCRLWSKLIEVIALVPLKKKKLTSLIYYI